MKRKLLSTLNLFLIFFLPLFIFGQQKRASKIEKTTAKSYLTGAFIDVNSAAYPESSYNITDLITNVLISGGSNCNQSISNVKVSPNLAATSTSRSWGYFNAGTTAFPFGSGIILSTGYARKAGNNIISNTLSDHLGTSGDADLAAAIGVSNSILYDATYVEFDFVPFTTTLNFSYLLTSEEYTDEFPCSYTDGFALLIKKAGDANYTNLAKLPNGDAVSITNIHPTISGSDGCPAKNASFFYGYNTTNTQTNFNGRTIPLTATATVIPGATYHFKMVLADYLDDEYDTAVFLQAGSFNLGIDLQDGDGTALSTSTTVCSNAPKTIVAVSSVTNPTYKWYKDGVLIAGATTNSYTISEAGVYKVEVYVSTSNCPESTKSITVTLAPSPTASDTSMQSCSSGTTAVFNLLSHQPNISSQTDVTFKFYENEPDAQAGNNNIIPTANLANYTSGSKTIYVRVSNGTCFKVAKLTLNVTSTSAAPNISASSLILCGNSTIILTSSSTTGNVWSTGETTQSINVTSAGTYSVYATNGSCTSQTSSITITQQPGINLQISGNLTPCYGANTTLTSSSATGNLWSNGATTQSITVATSGTYSVTVSTASGCTFTKSVNVVAQPDINLQISGNLTLCSAANTTLTSSSATGNVWSNGATTQSITITTPGTYSVTVTTTAGCIFTKSVNVIAQPDINLQISGNLSPCFGTNTTLTSSSTTGNVWSNGATTQSITVANSGTYSVTVTTPAGCTFTKSVTVVAQPDINLKISGNLTPCNGTSTVLTSSSATGNVWSNGATTQSITVANSGTYTLTVTTASGCKFTKSVNVAVIPKISLNIATPQTLTCILTSFALDASGSNYQAGDIISWTTLDGNIVSGANTLNPIINKAGTYTLTLTRNNCSESTSVLVKENKQPPTIVLKADRTIICDGESATLTVSGADSYVWTGFPTTQNILTVSPTKTTTYSVTGTSSINGCSTIESITITVLPKIVSNLEGGQICTGDSIVLDAGSGPGYIYTWNTGDKTQTITVKTIGDYTVTIDNGACSETYTAKVTQAQIPKISQVIYEGNIITIVATNPSNGVLEFTIDGITWQSSNIFKNAENNERYNVGVRVKGTSCSVVKGYFTFYIPNVITPNNDGYNDTINFRGINALDNFQAKIFNRNGIMVYEATPDHNIWEGKYNGQILPSTTYWYIITWNDPITNELQSKIGWIFLKNRE